VPVPNYSFEDGYSPSAGNCLAEPSGLRTGVRLCTYNSDPVFNPSWYGTFQTGGNTSFEVYDNTFVIAFNGNNSAGLNTAGNLQPGNQHPINVQIDLSTGAVSTYNLTFAYIGSPETNATLCGSAIPTDFTFNVQAVAAKTVLTSSSFTSKKANFPGGTPADWHQGWISWQRTSSNSPATTTIIFSSTTPGGCGPIIDYVFINAFTVQPTSGSSGTTGSTGTTLPSTSTTGTTGSTASSGTTGSTGSTGTTGSTGSTGSSGTTGSTGTTGIPGKVWVIELENCTEAENIKVGIYYGFSGADSTSWVGLYNYSANTTVSGQSHVAWAWTCEKTLTGCETTIVNGDGWLWVPSYIPDGMYVLRLYRNGYSDLAGTSTPFMIMEQCPAPTTGTTLVHYSTGTTGSTGSSGTTATSASSGTTIAPSTGTTGSTKNKNKTT